jgi:hypothetical protein
MELYNTRNDLFESLDKKLIICEIGVFKGDFSKFLKDNLDPKELHLIDIFEGMMCSGDKDGNNIIYSDLSRDYENLLTFFQNDKSVFLHKGKSFDILNGFEDNYFDIIYIDGDHTYEGVKKDLEVSLKKIKKTGFICGHDYTQDKFPGVVKAVSDFKLQNNFEISHLTKDGCPSFCLKPNKYE